jgi:group II intron reverse transcriptase/maturase
MKKVHSLIDKVYHKTNLERAWKQVGSNKGAGGIDKITLKEYETKVEENLEVLRNELRENRYEPKPVRRVYIEKLGSKKDKRPLGIPTIHDRVCQQALKNRLEPIMELYFNDCSFGYRAGRSPHMAMRCIWGSIQEGNEWIVDADLKDYFGSVNHELLIDLIARKVSDGKILKLIRDMLEAGYVEEGNLFQSKKGTPQGAVISPLLSNIYLTPFDNVMTSKGYRLVRFADDWVVTCKSKQEALEALRDAQQILEKLGLRLNPDKTRITHIKWGFEFLGYKIKQGKGHSLSAEKRKTKGNQMNLYAVPRDKSIQKFKDEIRKRTKRKTPLTMKELIDGINPVIAGWGNYFKKAHVRGLFNQLDRWIIRRLWSHHYKRWRNSGWKKYPAHELYAKYGLVNMVRMIPGIQERGESVCGKAECGRTARSV